MRAARIVGQVGKRAGAANAALFAVSILSVTSVDYANRLAAFRVRQNEAAHAMVLPPLA